jgi:hypothetical protein
MDRPQTKPVWSACIIVGMRGCSRFVSTLAMAFMGQFCRDIGLKASGVLAASVFGNKPIRARFILDRFYHCA